MSPFFRRSSSMWFERASALLGLAREVSWGWVCPVHCGSSLVLPLIAGVAIGFLFGFLLAASCCVYLWIYHLHPAPQSAPSPASPKVEVSSLARRSARLARYLDEQPRVH